jgi:hypothetical protein
VQKIESKANVKVIKEPVEIQLSNNLDAFVVAIGINGSYLAVIPGRAKDGTHLMGPLFAVWWTEKQSTAFEQTEISKYMTMWIISSDESDFKDIPHRDFDHVKLAIDTIIAIRGIDYFENGKPLIELSDQGIARQVRNPHR